MSDHSWSVQPVPELRTLTTMRVGGAPTELLQPATTAELIATTRAVWDSGVDWLLLGGGSNTIASDDGFDGTVIRILTHGIERVPVTSDDDATSALADEATEGVAAAPGFAADGSAVPETVRLRVQAGESWDDLVSVAVRNGWSGIEALAGIPGSVGAAPVQNIGAYGQELSSRLVAIDFLEHPSGVVRRVPASELELGYRTSALKHGMTGVVLSIELDLINSVEPLGAPLSQPILYSQLADSLGVELGSRVSLAELRRTVLALRASKGMVLDPDDVDSVSAGSFFTNPIVTENFARRLPADAPRWPTIPPEPDIVTPLDSAERVGNALRDGVGTVGGDEPFTVKLSAAWLIERAGIRRGYALPGSRAAISGKHTLAITNRGGASAQEIVQLATFVQWRVQSDFGVILQPEPVLVGLEL